MIGSAILNLVDLILDSNKKPLKTFSFTKFGPNGLIFRKFRFSTGFRPPYWIRHLEFGESEKRVVISYTETSHLPNSVQIAWHFANSDFALVLGRHIGYAILKCRHRFISWIQHGIADKQPWKSLYWIRHLEFSESEKIDVINYPKTSHVPNSVQIAWFFENFDFPLDLGRYIGSAISNLVNLRTESWSATWKPPICTKFGPNSFIFWKFRFCTCFVPPYWIRHLEFHEYNTGFVISNPENPYIVYLV